MSNTVIHCPADRASGLRDALVADGWVQVSLYGEQLVKGKGPIARVEFERTRDGDIETVTLVLT